MLGDCGCRGCLVGRACSQFVGRTAEFLGDWESACLAQPFLLVAGAIEAQCATAFWTVRTFNVVPWAFYPANLLAGPTMLVLGLLVGTSLLLPISCGVETWAVAFADGLAGGGGLDR